MDTLVSNFKNSTLIVAGLFAGAVSIQQSTQALAKVSNWMKRIMHLQGNESEHREKFESMTPEQLMAEFKRIIVTYNREFESSKIMEQIIEKTISPSTQIGKQASKFSHTNSDSTQLDLQKALCEPIWEMLSRGGKRVRPIFCALLAEAFNRQFSDVIEIAGFIEVLHNSSLIIDDIEDNSLKRREKDAVHIMYGVDIAINAGNYAYFAPLNYLLGLKKYNEATLLKLSRVYADEMTQIHFGQGWDLLWHNLASKQSVEFPSESQYLQMVVNKTGLLFRMMARMTSIVLNLSQTQQTALSSFTEKIGAAFQIQDDIINVDSAKYTTKGIQGEDIYEGKITIIVLHCIANATQEKKVRLTEILAMKTQDPALIKEAIVILEETGSITYAKNFADTLMKEAWEILDKCLPESSAKYSLKLICEYVTKRSQ